MHEEKEEEEHDHQSVLVKLCGRKVLKFIQDGIIIFTIILLTYARSSLDSSRFLWYSVYTEMEEARQWVIFFLIEASFLKTENPAIMSSISVPVT